MSQTQSNRRSSLAGKRRRWAIGMISGRSSWAYAGFLGAALLASALALSSSPIRSARECMLVQQGVSFSEYIDTAAPWPKFQNDVEDAGVGTGLGASGQIKWTETTEAGIQSSAAIDEQGTIYFGSNDGYIYAFTKNNTLKWHFFAGAQAQSSPLLGHNVVYAAVAGDPGNVFALNETTGQMIWQANPPTGPDLVSNIQGPLSMGGNGLLYAGSYAIDSRTGHVVQNLPIDGSNSVAVEPVKGTVYAADSTNSKLVALNPSGRMLWSNRVPVSGSPAVGSSGSVYVGTQNGTVVALKDNLNGTYINEWESAEISDFSGPFNLAVGKDGTVYAATYTVLAALNGTTGEIKWRYDANSFIYCAPAIAGDGTIYFQDHAGDFYALDSSTGELKWSKRLGTFNPEIASTDSSPAIAADGTVYVGTQDGVIHAIGFDTISHFFTSPNNIATGYATDGVVQLSAPTQSTAVISLTSNNPGALSVPPAVTIPVGGSAVSFRMTAGHVTAVTHVLLTAKLGNSVLTSTTTIDPYVVYRAFASPASLTGGDTTDLVVQLTGKAVSGDNVVSLNSNSPALGLPSSTTVPIGASGVSFHVRTQPVSATTTVTITATLAPYSAIGTITLQPWGLAHFFVSPTSVVGGQASDGVIQLIGPAGPVGNVVTLTSSDAAVVVPETVTVPAGTTGVSFKIKTEPAGTSAKTVTLTAKFNGQSLTTTIMLTP